MDKETERIIKAFWKTREQCNYLIKMDLIETAEIVAATLKTPSFYVTLKKYFGKW